MNDLHIMNGLLLFTFSELFQVARYPYVLAVFLQTLLIENLQISGVLEHRFSAVIATGLSTGHVTQSCEKIQNDQQ